MCPIWLKLNYFLFLKMVEKLIVAKWSQGSIINISYKKWRTFFRQRKNTNLSNYWHLRIYILWTILLDIHFYYLFDNISIWLQWPCCRLICDRMFSHHPLNGEASILFVTYIDLISFEEWYQHGRSCLFFYPKYLFHELGLVYLIHDKCKCHS